MDWWLAGVGRWGKWSETGSWIQGFILGCQKCFGTRCNSCMALPGYSMPLSCSLSSSFMFYELLDNFFFNIGSTEGKKGKEKPPVIAQ